MGDYPVMHGAKSYAELLGEAENELTTLRTQLAELESKLARYESAVPILTCMDCGRRYWTSDAVCPCDLETRLAAAERELAEARDVLRDIAGGCTSQYVDAPDPMTAESPAAFQHDMWVWSQKIARLAADTEGGKNGPG